MNKRNEYEDIYGYDIEDNTRYEELDENEDIEDMIEKIRGTIGRGDCLYCGAKNSLFYGGFMRYHYDKPTMYSQIYGQIYICKHPVYNRCTLFKIGNKGLAVIQQRFNSNTKNYLVVRNRYLANK